jgi:hypothetical protein
VNRTIVALILLSVLALACSGSHHSSNSTEPQPSFTDLALGQGNGFAMWTCDDACGKEPPKDFQIYGWKALADNDVCGSAFNCKYNCTADCSKP